ncbi:MAG TPA: hypothetical protein VLY46_05185 [Usitatibacter sp.]|nr:hypothetical protein [Usitatibacter sp.]
MAAIVQDRTCRLVRAVAEALHRFADRLERAALSPRALEPLKPSDDVDERIHESRHRLFVRYY